MMARKRKKQLHYLRNKKTKKEQKQKIASMIKGPEREV